MTNSKPPLCVIIVFGKLLIQLIFVFLAVVIILWGNVNRNLQQLGIQFGFNFLKQQASFDIGETSPAINQRMLIIMLY